MDTDEALIFLDTFLGQVRLNNVQELVFRRVWEGWKYAAIAESSGYDADYIKFVGSNLWKLLSKAIGEEITKSNVRSILRRKRLAANSKSQIRSSDTNVSSLDGNGNYVTRNHEWEEVPDRSIFYGRIDELAELERFIADRSCLIALLGMGGIGKTALALKLAERVQERFEFSIWHSLRNAPPLGKLLDDSIEFLTKGQDISSSDPIENKIARLIEHLRSHRCLLVLDNFETIFREGDSAGCYREGYEDYGNLLNAIAEESHQSCLILTSREKPKEIALLEAKHATVRSLQLSGLQTEACIKMLTEHRLLGSENAMSALSNRYQGNPLALKIVSNSIRELFIGQIDRFLAEDISAFNKIWILLEQQFQRLSDLEQQIMYWLAINREPVLPSELHEDIVPPVPKRKLFEALESLARRSLIEQSHTGLTQQQVVMEFVTEKLIETIHIELQTDEIQFFDRYALYKATVKDYVRDSQVRMILEPVLANLRINLSLAEIEAKLKDKIAKIRQEKRTRYGASNAIALLWKAEIDLSGYDLSGLTIRQAYFQDVCLHGVNFSGSHFFKSTFNESSSNFVSVEFSPDGNYLASSDNGGTIYIRDLDGRVVKRLEGHFGWVWATRFSNDSKVLASCCSDGKIKVWDVSTGQCLHTFDSNKMTSWLIGFSPDGKRVASGCGDCSVKLWDVCSGECVKTLLGHTKVASSVTFTPDGTILASGSEDGSINLWDVEKAELLKTLIGHKNRIWAIAVSPDGKLLASGSLDATVKIWDIATGECSATLQGDRLKSIYSIAFHPHGKILAVSGEHSSISLWDVSSRECIQTLHGHRMCVWSIAFNPRGSVLASASNDQTLKLWDLNRGSNFRSIKGFKNCFFSVSFSPDGKFLLIGGNDKRLRLYDRSHNLFKTVKAHDDNIMCLSFSKDGNLLASCSQDGSIMIWDSASWKCLRTIRGGREPIFSVNFSPNRQFLVSGGLDTSLKVWNPDNGELLKAIDSGTGIVCSVCYSPDGKMLASSHGSDIKLWDTTTWECLKTLREHQDIIFDLAFSSDSQTLVSASFDSTIELWDVDMGICKHTFQGHTQPAVKAKLNPLENLVASCSHDGMLRVWDRNTGDCLHVLSGHTNGIYDIAFHPKENLLASVSHDETIRLWDVEQGKNLKVIKPERIYEGMNVTKVKGLNQSQIATLTELGAVLSK
ncbi:NB-ARC domain-containing protein [Tumidithrix elongata RA019]|uniref:NB-ARC domain-containing protein n=1 Tax=Tumidithrix elongata BACA0141 TaxID=2716417 RepID=A0AAW9Q9C2_9CYAN|nr:NB-ARC domain-containing protein [Tumidithrix elongata RA019]